VNFQNINEIKTLKSLLELAYTDSYTDIIKINNVDSNSDQYITINNPFTLLFENSNIVEGNLNTLLFTIGSHHLHGSVPLSILSNNGNRPLHHHEHLEIMYVLSGSVTHKIEDKVYTYQSGQCCLMNKNIKHCEEFTSDFQALFFLFHDEFIMDIIKEGFASTSVTIFNKVKKEEGPIHNFVKENLSSKSNYEKVYMDFTPIVSPTVILETFNPLMDQIVEEIINGKPGHVFIVKGLLARFFSILEDPSLYYWSEVHSDSNSQDYIFAKITHLFEASHGRLTRSELEESMHYNGEYLNRVVKKYTGFTLMEYSRKFMLKEAKNLLLNTSKNISEIISELGYSNRSYFYKLFSQEYGVTPLEYRNKHKKNG